MRLTKSTSHAIRILIDCARADDRLVKVAELSERLQITPAERLQDRQPAGASRPDRGHARPQRRRAAGAPARRRSASATSCAPPRSRTSRSRTVAVDAASRRGRGVNQILDDALGAFIDVLDQHTLADMANGQTRASARPPSARAPQDGGTPRAA